MLVPIWKALCATIDDKKEPDTDDGSWFYRVVYQQMWFNGEPLVGNTHGISGGAW